MERKKETEKKDRKNTPPAGNAITLEDGVEIYPDLIAYYADEYEESRTEEARKLLYKPHSQSFTGMIKYISERVDMKPCKENIDILWNVWKSYTSIVYNHNQLPNILEFSLFTDIARDTFYSWAKGETRAKDTCETLTLSRSDTVKKMLSECENARYKLAESGNVGGIFLAKAVDGLVETAPAPTYNPVQVRDNLEIASKMGLLLSDNNAHGGDGETS